MQKPPLNIDYWASLYPGLTNYTVQYQEAMEYPTVLERAKQLWEWKGLNRSVPFDEISSQIEQFDWNHFLNQDRKTAIETISTELKSAGVVKSNSLVTSSFLLHLAASGDEYSKEYPIYDSRVWNAYVYLWGVRGTPQQLYTQASTASTKYDNFCNAFSQTCPNGKAQEYERALFIFGRFISNLPPKNSPTPIEKIDQILQNQEIAVTNMVDTSGYALVNTSEIQNSE